MKIYLMSLLLCCTYLVNTQAQSHLSSVDSVYTSTIFDQNLPSHYYTGFIIKAPDYTGPVVIHTQDLARFLLHTNGLRDSSYKEFMRAIIQQGDTLVTTHPIDEPGEKPGSKKWGFRKVVANEEVEYYAQLGQAAFLSHFFQADSPDSTERDIWKRGIWKNDTTGTVGHLHTAAIYQLIMWRIYVSLQGGTGRLQYSLDGPGEAARQWWKKVRKQL